jgi:antitoxin PrlF
MPTDATLTSKGQTTIPKEIRDGLGMKTGDRITFTLMPGATVLMRVKSKSVKELAGLLCARCSRCGSWVSTRVLPAIWHRGAQAKTMKQKTSYSMAVSWIYCTRPQQETAW